MFAKMAAEHTVANKRLFMPFSLFLYLDLFLFIRFLL